MAKATGDLVATLPPDPVRESLKALQEEQKAVQARKRELAAKVKAAHRRQARLRKRARQLTDEDLVAVLMMRQKTTPGTGDADACSAAAGGGRPSDERSRDASPERTGTRPPSPADLPSGASEGDVRPRE